ncbi:hypothetical protein T11_8372 [Trichinella zimbabwensis]|uniref:Uncharacterized protein n=1 Tax=Trichinella zimbabwensis TaxID=268475 RepID=A0A0V1G8N5_9BILA|nr:hypothetical protein T11_8372 [Trichinella zimbabwensis]
MRSIRSTFQKKEFHIVDICFCFRLLHFNKMTLPK